MPDPIRIVVAEDNYLVREGIRRLLDDSGQVDIAATVSSAPELLDAVERLQPQAVLTDIRMPPGHHTDGIEAAHTIRRHNPTIGVVVLSQHAEEAYAFQLFQYGTAGLAYLLKERLGDLDDLIRALREVVAGRSVVDPQVVDLLVSQRARLAQSPVGKLSPRDVLLIADMLGEGVQARH